MAKNRGKKRLLAALILCAALGFALLRAFGNLNGALLALAEARAEQRALQQISLALDEVMHKSLDYEDLSTSTTTRRARRACSRPTPSS